MNKVYTMSEAISKFVNNGDHICFGGFTTNRKPYAAVGEIIRQGKKDFIVQAGPAGGDWDMLIGEGRVKAYINCYTANSGYTNVARRFRDAVEKKKILIEDYSQDALMLMLHALALGLPFIPVNLMKGTSLLDMWGISKDIRKTIDKLPNEKFVYLDNPFNPGEQIVALPVPRLDTAIIHVQKASPNGTCSIEGDEFHDIDIAVAAKNCIVTCEELVSNAEICRELNNSIPGFVVSAVVHAPYGAHPSQCYNYYDYDGDYFKSYDKASKTDEGFESFVKEWFYDLKDHSEYLNKLGATRLIDLKVIPGLGYSMQSIKGVK